MGLYLPIGSQTIGSGVASGWSLQGRRQAAFQILRVLSPDGGAEFGALWLPVTIRFADKVGDILVMGSAKHAEMQPFKFYI